MKIAVSADCFASFTSGFPVRGMTLELIRNNPDVQFILLYSDREKPKALKEFYTKINSLPNTEVRYFKDKHKILAVKSMIGVSYVELDSDVDCFLNPGRPEYIKSFRGPQIGSLADLSAVRGVGTTKLSWFHQYWGRFSLRRTLPRLARVVTISRYTQEDLHSFFPHLEVKTQCIYNGIDSFWFDDIFPGIHLEDLGIREPYFIWWGMMSRRKNICNLVSAYREAKRKEPRLPQLVLIGGILNYMSGIESSFGGDVLHLPFQDDYTLKYLVRHSRGLIFPSFYEGFGLPVVEAFSQGVNVACSAVTSLPEISNDMAILFDPHDAEALQAAILALDSKQTDPEVLKAYASQFTYAKAASQYMKLIRELIE